MINNYPQVTFVYDRRKIASPERKAAVELRITYQGKQKFLSTGILLYPNQWKKGCIINCPDAIQISETLDKQLSTVRQILLEMINQGNIDLNALPMRLSQKRVQNLSFLEYCKTRAEVRKHGISPDSQLRYDRFLKFFAMWGRIISFDDVTDFNIISYDNHLKAQELKKSSIWNNYHRFLNSFILDAINDGYLTRNPYNWIKLDKRRTDSLSKCLTPEEVQKVKMCDLPTKSLEKVRDIFIFQIYTCLSYSDLCKFSLKHVQDIQGMKVYIDTRKKTEIPFTIPLLAPAWDILMKYQGRLPLISNPKYNEYLKVIAQAAGIDKPISTHWARHTGATLLLNEGIPMEIVSRICGHSSIKITEKVYAKLLDETVVDAIKNIQQKVK